jgi:hypothetical protein
LDHGRSSDPLHHLLLAGAEGVPHIGLLNVEQYTDGDARARFRLEDARDRLAHRVVEEEKDADVDALRRGLEVLEKDGEESIAVHEVLDEVHAQRLAHRTQTPSSLPRLELNHGILPMCNSA